MCVCAARIEGRIERPKRMKPVHLQWAQRAPDGAIQAQAPHAALLPSRRLKSTRPIAVGPPATAAALAPADCLSDGLCCGRLGRSSGASQQLGGASFAHAATTKLSGPSVEVWCELHARGGCGHSRSTRRTSKLAVGVLSWLEPRQLQRSRVQWRARSYLGHQVVALAHSDQGCALVGLCLSMCEVGVRAGGVCG